jgi:type IV secretory pathway TrbL component
VVAVEVVIVDDVRDGVDVGILVVTRSIMGIELKIRVPYKMLLVGILFIVLETIFSGNMVGIGIELVRAIIHVWVPVVLVLVLILVKHYFIFLGVKLKILVYL